jgi:hypothetical protein
MTLGRLFAGVLGILTIAAASLTVGAHVKDAYYEALISQSDQIINASQELPPLQAEEPKTECKEEITQGTKAKVANTVGPIKFTYVSETRQPLRTEYYKDRRLVAVDLLSQTGQPVRREIYDQGHRRVELFYNERSNIVVKLYYDEQCRKIDTYTYFPPGGIRLTY